MRMLKVSFAALLVVMMVCVIASKPTMADGALAVGMSNNFNDGIAFGWGVNYKTTDEASAASLRNCQEQDNPVRRNCRVLATFKKECFAYAFTPSAPGAGWATAADKDTAEQRALAFCALTAGAGRGQLCKINKSQCDTD